MATLYTNIILVLLIDLTSDEMIALSFLAILIERKT